MAVLRQKKRNILIAVIAGLAVGILPTGIIAGILWNRYNTLDRLVTEEKERYKPYTGYVLNSQLARGHVMTADDIREITFYSASDLETVDVSGLIGMTLRQETKEGIIITEPMVYKDTGLEDNLRMYMFDYIAIPKEADNGAMFDIRISFPNGEDYIVAKGKTLESRTEEGIFINATERELLMISSAYVDTTVYEGAKIYASIYVTDYQSLSVVNYPVNLYVTRLSDWNPNLIEEIKENMDVEKRQVLEENLYEFMGVSIGNAYYE